MCVFVNVCEREREREIVCQRRIERMCVCVNVCVRERERERERITLRNICCGASKVLFCDDTRSAFKSGKQKK